MANRAVDWYRSRAGAESSQEDTRAGLGDALYRAERWSESLAVFTSLAAKHSGNISYKSRLGSLAARMHDPASATRIADGLRRLGGGGATLQSARILALLPDKDRAVALLREAIAEGLMGAGISTRMATGWLFVTLWILNCCVAIPRSRSLSSQRNEAWRPEFSWPASLPIPS